MEFRIHVADRKTGEERQVTIDAATVQQARARMTEAGYLVSTIERTAEVPRQLDEPMPAGGIFFGPILGAIVGYKLGGPLGIVGGAICGALAGTGIGTAITPWSGAKKLGIGGRLALAVITFGIAVAMFFGFCILPLNWRGSEWSSNRKDENRTRSSTPNAENYSEADRALRAVGKNPNDVTPRERAELQQSIKNLSDTSERNKQYAPSSLDRARDYARSEYESNRKIMSEPEARRQYDKDLAIIAQEAREKGINR